MGRITTPRRSYSHRIYYLGWATYRLSWTVDSLHRKIRYPHGRSRDTDRAGAERFAKKWGCTLPEKPADE